MPVQITLRLDETNAIVSSVPVAWAVGALRDWLDDHGDELRGDGSVAIRVLGSDSGAAESFTIRRDADAGDADAGDAGLVVVGADPNGVLYGLLEILDTLQTTRSLDGLLERLPLTGTPANRVRGILRSYVSRVEDAEWYLDRAFWDGYLTELAQQRFNQLQLAFGIGIEYGHDPGVSENYLLFSYPFLVDLPDYPVSVVELSGAERDANLAALRYASDAAAERGIAFHLGLWTNGTELDDGIAGDYTIEGITPQNHADYCRDALRAILEACPSIRGVTLRVHYESGIPEPAHEFWKKLFDGIAAVGRPISIDMHSKGVETETIAAALGTGLETVLSAKFLAEHLGLPYQQAAIRERELPVEESGDGAGFASVTRGSRRATRYGYADYLARDREYRMIFRHWPGTQRLLLWGDPAFAAGYGRSASFSGSDGAEFFEPLSYKGRKGSGSAGGRQVYSDPHLAEGGAEWRKYRYTYRLLGRMLYDPETDPVEWRRYLECEFGTKAAAPAELALSRASRILPLVTVSHGVSAANSVYWPEMYENLGIADGGGKNEFYLSDSDAPHTFGSAATLDPEVFESIHDSVSALLDGTQSGRLGPFATATILDGLADEADAALAALEAASPDASPAQSRLAVDVRAQLGLGRFFASKLRAGMGYELFERTGSAAHLDYSIERYEEAAQHWRSVVEATGGYKPDLAFGFQPHLRGHWADRQASIDADVRALRVQRASSRPGPAPTVELRELENHPLPVRPELRHEPVEQFTPGAAVTVTVGGEGLDATEVELRYRHTNQAERYRSVAMTRGEAGFQATIPAEYSDSPFDLAYFFVVRAGSETTRYPGLGDALADQPYFVVAATPGQPE